MNRSFDRTSLAGGLAVVAVGVLLLFDQQDVFQLSLGVVGAMIAAALGVVLLVSGLDD